MTKPLAYGEREAAAALNATVAQLRRWRSRGVGPGWVKTGCSRQSRILYPVAEIELWLAAGAPMTPGRAGPPGPRPWANDPRDPQTGRFARRTPGPSTPTSTGASS